MSNGVSTKSRLDEIVEGLQDTGFAWCGSTTHRLDRKGATYFRIQGPKLIIEFSPHQPGVDSTMHVHTIYPDLAIAYGRLLS
jgi:hypothetical protein